MDGTTDSLRKTLKKRTAGAILWMSGATILSRGIQIAVTLILAKLLAPNDFGLVGLAMIAINTLAIFREMGISQALIYRRGDIGQAANTAFLLLPLQGLAMFIIAFLAAPLIANFFNAPESSSLIRILSLGLIISSFGLVPATLLERELSFGRKFVPEVAPVVGYSVAALLAASRGWGVWSLVAGELSRCFLIATAVWPFSKWRPRLSFSRDDARMLLSYGRHVVGASIAIFLFTTIDNMTIAKGLGTEQLGFYVFAFSLGTMPITYLAYSINRVLFPVYSSFQQDRSTLSKAYEKTFSFTSMITVPVAIGTLIVAPVFLTVLYGDKWDGAVRVLQILTLYGLFRAFGVSAGDILKSVGKPKKVAQVTYLQLLLILLPLYPVVEIWGINGIGALFTASIVASSLTLVYLACRASSASFRCVMTGTLYPLLCSGTAAVIASLVSYGTLGGNSIAAMISATASFILLYLLFLSIMRHKLFMELCHLVKVAFSSAT